MNRRGFLTGLAAAAASFAILPSAKTYGRTWSFTKSGILTPGQAFVSAEYEISFLWSQVGDIFTTANFSAPVINKASVWRYSMNQEGVFERQYA